MSSPAVKRALVTGITGQDGSFLAELLLEKACVIPSMVLTSPSGTEMITIKVPIR